MDLMKDVYNNNSLLILQGGGIIRLFHRTHECYIVAEGSFAGRFASIETNLVQNCHERRGLSPSISRDIQTEFSGDVSYQDMPHDERMLGSHIQQVEVEVYDHESSDRGDSELKYTLSSIRSDRLNRSKSVFSPEGSLKVSDQAVSYEAATIQKSSSITVDEDYQHVVTNDGK